MSGSRRSACTARTRAASWSRSWKTSSPATSSTISPPRWKSSSTASPTTRSPGSRCCRISGRGFIGAVNDIKDLRVTAGAGCARRHAGPAHLSAARGWRRSGQCPTCGTGKLNLKAGKFGAFVGCTNYPECRYTRPLAADSEASADRILGKDPDTDLDVIVQGRPFRPLYPARRAPRITPRREAEARRHPEEHLARRHRTRPGAEAAVAAARDRQASGDRRADHRGYRPLRAVREAREDLRQPGSGRRGVRYRPQPRRDPDRREDR